MIGGDPASYSQYDLINTSGRSSRSSCYKQTPLVSLPPGKMPQEGEWPRNEVSMSTDNEGEWYGKDGGMIREGKWPIIDGGRTIMREGEWRAKADSWSVGEGERTTKEGLLLPRDGDYSLREREAAEGALVSREGMRKYDPQAYTPRHNPRPGDHKAVGGGSSAAAHMDATRPDMSSKRCGGVFTDDSIQPQQDSWESTPSDGEVTKDGTVRRRYSHTTKKPLLSKSPDVLPSPVGSQKQTPSPKGPSSPMDCSDSERQMESSDVAESSETDLPLSKTSSTQDLPARLPTTASIQELDHFLSAIIHNLEAQLQTGGSISIKGRPGEALTAEGLKRKRKKRKDDDGPESRIPELVPLRTKKMSECGACGRRWVEPRLLPCLHTVCTPCLHARAAHIPTPNTSSTPTYSPSTLGSYPAPPQPYDGKISLQSSPLHSNRPPSQERTLSTPTPLPVPPPPTVIPPTPNHSPSTPSPSHPSPASPSNNAAATPSDFVSHSCGNLSRHWNGDSSGHIPGDSNNNSAVSASQCNQQFVNGNQTSQQDPQHHHHHHHHHLHHHHHQKQHHHHHQSENQQHQDKLAAASEDLDSVIELLTNLSPNVPSNAPTRPTSPKMTVTPTPSPVHTPTDASLPPPPPPPVASCPENDVASPSSTLDSRGSSKTRSSGRSSSCESVNRNKGVWVVWCHECGFEAQVPPGGVECFPLNYILQKQLVLEALNSSSTTVFCDLCQEDVVAEERCDTCPVNLCRLCSRAHTRQRRTNHHKVISLQEARNMGIREVAHTLVCATHGEGEVGWWCRGCQEPLCASCLATLHRGHPTVTVDQEAPHAKSNLTSLLDLSSNRMGELLGTVEDLTGAAARVQQRGRAVTDQVNAFIDDYIMALEEHRHTLLRQIRQACERAQRGIVMESQKAGQTASWLRQGCDLTHDLLHHAGDAETLALAPIVTLRLQHLLNEDVRGWARWERLTLLRDHRAGKVRGHRLHGVIADTPAHPPSSRLKLLGDVNNIAVGTRVSALVVARDVDGQPITHGGEDVGAMVLTRDGNILCSCSVRDREDGSYEVTFSPPVPMSAMLKVTIQGAHVQDSPLDIMITPTSSAGQSSSGGGDASCKERGVAVPGRQHTGIFHCCTFCSSSGDKTATCACGATMPGGYMGCGHNHAGHPGKKHWSCCAQTSATAPCTRPPSQYYQVTL
ncbi:uncharacterized protein LOC135196299 [Macrobrachium nipponense]|uniref:uncharacterized protein LOC135196299 n=1 Tax=Macrobrachium nipponense TaxID=159736 RepID=UPI0030C7CCA9